MTAGTNKVGYQFTAMPKQLTHLLDVNLRSMLFSLVDASDYFADEEGWFYRSNADLQTDSAMSQNLVKATVDTLFIYSLLEVTCVGKGKKREPNGYRLNKDMFQFFESLDMNIDMHRPDNKIHTVGYKGSGYHPSYLDDEPERYLPELVKGKIIWNQTNDTKASATGDTTVTTTEPTKESTTNVTKSDNNIDDIETEYNKEFKDNKEDTNNDYINININIKEKMDNEKEELEREMEEGVTEPNSKNENEGKEDPNESQFNKKNPSGENQDSISVEVIDGESYEDCSSQSQSNKEESERQEDRNTCVDDDTYTEKPVQTWEDEPQPDSLRTLQDYFHKRLRQMFKERIPDSENYIQQSKEKLYQELEGFSGIRDYRYVRYTINDACRKETDRLMERILASR